MTATAKNVRIEVPLPFTDLSFRTPSHPRNAFPRTCLSWPAARELLYSGQLSEACRPTRMPPDPPVHWRRLLQDRAELLCVSRWLAGRRPGPSSAAYRGVRGEGPPCNISRLHGNHVFPAEGPRTHAQCRDLELS